MGCKGLQFCGYWEFAKRCGKVPIGKASGLAGSGTVCACARRPPVGTFRVKHGPHAELKKEPVVASNDVSSNAFEGVCADWSTPYGSRR